MIFLICNHYYTCFSLFYIAIILLSEAYTTPLPFVGKCFSLLYIAIILLPQTFSTTLSSLHCQKSWKQTKSNRIIRQRVPPNATHKQTIIPLFIVKIFAEISYYLKLRLKSTCKCHQLESVRNKN